MTHILIKTCAALLLFGVLAGPEWSRAAMPDDRTEADSIRKQQLILEQLDFISEHTIPLIDEVLDFSTLPELTPPTIKGRLRKLEDQVPLTYNTQVQQFIDRYSTNQYRGHIARMMGLGQYYFGLYERIFKEMGVPTEIKYLSVVESALDPHAVSRVGATGPWQFMFATAKMYGLEMNSDIDERKDPIAASYAAARYLTEAYDQFGDWLLAIAAYNCGPGNVSRAIRRSGLENPDYWSIQRFLPRETRNYIPAFIAMTYMLEYHREYGIDPIGTELPARTEMVSVQQQVPFSSIAEALGVDMELIRALNPSYKRDKITGSFDTPRRLVLPVVDPQHYADLYAVLNEPSIVGDPDTGMLAGTSSNSSDIHSSESRPIAKNEQPRIYTVKKGDSLSVIAARHKGATVSGIKAANGLKSDRINPGMKLKIM